MLTRSRKISVLPKNASSFSLPRGISTSASGSPDSVAKLNDRWWHLVADFSQTYKSLSDSQATRFLEDYTKYDQDRIALRTTYIKRFGEILPLRKVVRYFQVENKLDAIINYDLAGEIPLAK